MSESKKILVTGGAGYIGGVLVPRLLEAGHLVTVLDAFHFGTVALDAVRGHRGLTLVAGDVRDADNCRSLLSGGFDVVIHLAAIANDPCADLEPGLTESVNRGAVEAMMRGAKAAGVKRFLYASSASVYGIKEEEDVTEQLALEPITLYAQCKAVGENVLNSLVDDDFCGCSVRAATVCGYAPRLRLDLTVNLFTDQALRVGQLRVFGGDQKRPNIDVRDLARFYELLVDAPAAVINGQAFNVCAENASVRSLAERVRQEVAPELSLVVTPTQDQRSYHLSGEKARRELDFRPEHDVGSAVRSVRDAFERGAVPEPADARYRNVEFMKQHPARWREICAWRPL